MTITTIISNGLEDSQNRIEISQYKFHRNGGEESRRREPMVHSVTGIKHTINLWTRTPHAMRIRW